MFLDCLNVLGDSYNHFRTHFESFKYKFPLFQIFTPHKSGLNSSSFVSGVSFVTIRNGMKQLSLLEWWTPPTICKN